MLKFKKVFNVKIISIFIIVLFVFNSAVYGIDLPRNTLHNKLRVPVGNSYERMLQAMQQKYEEHETSLDEKIKELAKDSKSLSEIAGLEDEFIAIIENGGFKDMFDRLNSVLVKTGGRIQVIFVEDETKLPKFEEKSVWGHAGTYITVFALRDENETPEERKKIIGRIFHEIRARSTIAKKRFNEVSWAALSESEAEIRELLNSFEKQNEEIQRQIEAEGKINNESLLSEFKALKFDEQVSDRLRDYTISIDETKISLQRQNGPFPFVIMYGTEQIGFIKCDILDGNRVFLSLVAIKKSYKGHDIGLLSLRLLRDVFPSPEFTFVGANGGFLYHLVEEEGIDLGRVEFINNGSPNKVFKYLSDCKPHPREDIVDALNRDRKLAKQKELKAGTIQLDLAFLVKAGVIERVGVATYQLRQELIGNKTLIAEIQPILDEEFKYRSLTKNLRIPDNRARIAAEIQILIKMPKGRIVTIDKVVEELGVNRRTARSALESLVKKGVLIVQGEGAYLWSISGGLGEDILHENRKDQADKLVTEGEAARQQVQYHTAKNAWKAAISIYNEIGEFGLAQTVQGMLDRLEEDMRHRRVRDQI